MLSDPGRVSSVVAITHAYWCLPARRRGRPLLDLCYGAQSLHFRYGLSVALSTLRRGRCLARRKAGFPLAGWALAGREFHPLDECGFVWAHLRFQSPLINPGMRFSRTRLSEILHRVAVGVAVYHLTVPTSSYTPNFLKYARL